MKKVLILDENFAVRQAIKRILGKFIQEGQKLQIYSSTNKIEGLAQIFSLAPDVIIVDLTLPKYSGTEILDYLTSNTAILEKSKVIVLIENSLNLELNSNFIIIDKSKRKFLDELEEVLRDILNISKPKFFANINKIFHDCIDKVDILVKNSKK